MAFHSILFDREDSSTPVVAEPPFFGDLHLDQIASALIAGRDQYELAPFFYRPLHSVEAVRYRHQVLRDLEQEAVLDAVSVFAHAMERMRKHLALARTLHYARQRQRWFLAAVSAYCESVGSFVEQLSRLELRAPGFIALRDHLVSYAQSDAFAPLAAETRELESELARITYAIQIKGNHVKVDAYVGEPDMSEEVEQTFAKFRHAAANDYRVRFKEYPDMNHVEAQILELVAKLHADTFARLEAYWTRHRRYLDETIGRFDREVQFYLAYLQYIAPLKAAGLAFCHPRVSTSSKEIHARETFDLALATKLVDERATVVCNGFYLTDAERILVVSGPNNGGKTTFARMFGQLHYLASLGLPVPGRDARLFLADQIFTHFEREEDIETLRGKFEDELYRIHEILERATGDSVLIMNESFGSTTLRDALLVGTEVMSRIIALDALCVFVTFVDELASLSDSTVSMVSTVAADDPTVRTYKLMRKPADGLAYAAAIAAKHGLTYDALRRRIAR